MQAEARAEHLADRNKELIVEASKAQATTIVALPYVLHPFHAECRCGAHLCTLPAPAPWVMRMPAAWRTPSGGTSDAPERSPPSSQRHLAAASRAPLLCCLKRVLCGDATCRWWPIMLASFRAKRTMWLAIMWACIFALAVGLLVGLLVRCLTGTNGDCLFGAGGD